MTKNLLRLTFDQAVKQSTYVRKLQPGDFTSLKNVRRPDDGPPEKRTGYDRTTTSTFSGATYAGPAAEMIPSDVVMWKDTSGQVWNRSGSTGYYRGTDRRAFPSYQQIQNKANEGRAHKPLQLFRGTEIWQFSLGVAGSGVSGYQVTVLDSVTRQPIREAHEVGADGVVTYAVALDASNNVWVFWVSGNSGSEHIITAHKFTTAASGPATVTTYASVAGYKFRSIAARLQDGEVIVAATSFDGTIPPVSILWWSLLDTATGAAKASPAPATEAQTVGGATDHQGCNGVSILQSDGSDGYFYLAYLRLVNADDDLEWRRLKISRTTLVAAESTQLQLVETVGGTKVPIGVSGGYMSGTTEVWGTTVIVPVAASNIDQDADNGETNVSSAITYKHSHASGVTTTTVLARSAYLAGDPVQLSGVWYWLTGFQDHDRTQRSYFLRDSSGNILTSILDGEGAEVFHAGGLAGGFGAADYNWGSHSGHVVNPLVVGSDIVIPLLREGLTTRSPAPGIATISFDETYHSTAPGVIPGGVPKRVSVHDQLAELTPIQSPFEPLSIVGNGAEVAEHSENVCTYRYAVQDADGRIRVSAPYPVQTLTFNDYATPATTYTVRLPTARHCIGQLYILFYGSTNGGTDPFLQRVILNNPAVDYIDLEVAPASWIDTGETIDTLGGALEQAPLPPARLAWLHRKRLFLAGTPDDSIWPSQEFESGRGPEFNEALAFEWGQGAGPVRAGCSLNHDAMVVFRENAIGVVTGAGPDGNAQNGGYEVATVATDKGCTNPASVVRAPFGAGGQAGVYFQCEQDGRIYVTAGTGPIEVGQGVDDYREETIRAAVYDEAHRLIRFFCASGRVLIVDTARATDSSPAGQWYVDESNGLNPAIGACVIGGAVIALEAGASGNATTFTQGTDYIDDLNDTVVLTDYVLGPIAPAGLLGEFNTYRCHISSTRLGGDSEFRYTFTDSVGNTEAHTDEASSTADVEFMTGLDRTREFYLRIEELSATGRGRVFDGLTLEIGTFGGRVQNPRRRIS